MTARTKHEDKTPVTDSEVRHKAVRLVVAHMKKKVTGDFPGIEYLTAWLEEMDAILATDSFDIKVYHRMRKELNSVIESALDESVRSSLRNSWFSMGKALEKKAEPH